MLVYYVMSGHGCAPVTSDKNYITYLLSYLLRSAEPQSAIRTEEQEVATLLQLAGTHINCSSTIVVLMCENIFSERIVRVWNSLPPSIVSFESLLSFRKSLGNVNIGIHTKY